MLAWGGGDSSSGCMREYILEKYFQDAHAKMQSQIYGNRIPSTYKNNQINKQKPSDKDTILS